jgi:hypothetical protein
MAFYVSVFVHDFYMNCLRMAMFNGQNIGLSQGNVERSVMQTVLFTECTFF